MVHIYSLNDDVQNSYDGYNIHNKKGNKWSSQGIKDAIAEAEGNEYKQST
jgi:hypothetical protein